MAQLTIAHEPAQSFGDVFALHELWKELGFDRAMGRGLRSGERKIDVEALVRAMVFNRLCAPDSKMGCLRWLETVAMRAMPEAVTQSFNTTTSMGQLTLNILLSFAQFEREVEGPTALASVVGLVQGLMA